ncbi:hypothetical protein AVEN_192943-1 [Araneus ventricosus]|uniref:Uncharacterized protein n=1 Tax=Araneus ventricosus TaxID=182803 RepID=A0A4Y2NL24_ARAVE|nr:hypothetical protein AVEN_192943-1 [Araneus ventricosus]
MGHVIHGGSKVRNHLSSLPLFLQPHTADSDFLASSRSSIPGISFEVALALHQGPKSESAHEELDFEFVGIPALRFRYTNLQRFFLKKVAFSFPSSKTSMACLTDLK